MKKRLMTLLFLLSALAVTGMKVDQDKRSIAIGGTSTPVSRCQIVVPERTPLLNFAAKELQYYLERATGQKIAITDKISSPEQMSLILGDNAYASKAGINLAKVPQQGYIIQRNGNQVYILGRDSKTAAPEQNAWGQCYQRGTLSAVYDFLERFADVRFYFPGAMGTVIPKPKAFVLPAKIDILDRPDFIDRRCLHYDGKWYENDKYNGVQGLNLNLLRLRMSEEYIPFGHGLAHMNYMERFKDKPEYFAMMPDGKRYNDPSLMHTGHLCFNSPIREEIYQDVKAYLSGKAASSRGCNYWNFNAARTGYFSLMTQDWLYWCGCPECRKISPPGREEAYAKYSQPVSDFMWQFTSDIANRLTREKIPGVVTQMAYSPYDKIPRCDIPQNVAVQLAVTGPGSGKGTLLRDDAKIRAWSKKLNSKLTLWTYPGKFGNKAMPGVPAMMHRHMGSYFKDRKDYLYGAFIESETDFYIFNYLNYYIFAKATWDTSADLDGMLEEHFKRMFRAGAPMMKNFYNQLEELWVKRIVGNTVDTGLGPVATLPIDLEIWNDIYSPAKLKEFQALFAQAEKAAQKDLEALKRIRFMRKNLLGPLFAAAAKFTEAQNALGEWRAPLPGSVHLRPYKGERNEVSTRVDLAETPEEFIFTFDCEEPYMDAVKAAATRRDDPKTFEDSCVELFINPSADRHNYFHFIVNSKGTLTDYRCKVNEPADINFSTGAKAEAKRTGKGYQVRISVPKKDLGTVLPEFPVNFARHRAISGRSVSEIYYQWSPLPGRSFHALDRFGTLTRRVASKNLIQDGSFDVTRRNNYAAGKWSIWQSGGDKKGQKSELDEKVFVSNGKSLHLVNTDKERMNAGQNIDGMKPNTRYRLSYFIKAQNLTGEQGAGAYMYFNNSIGQAFPGTQIKGTRPWHRVSFEFTSPETTGSNRKPVIGLWIWSAAGEAWFDDIKLEELPPLPKQ